MKACSKPLNNVRGTSNIDRIDEKFFRVNLRSSGLKDGALFLRRKLIFIEFYYEKKPANDIPMKCIQKHGHYHNSHDSASDISQDYCIIEISVDI